MSASHWSRPSRIGAGPARQTERLLLGAAPDAGMLAAGLLLVARRLGVRASRRGRSANLVAGGAAVLVAVPVLGAAWQSLRHPSLHGITDRLIALALIAAWATGDLMTAALLPIVMILGHVLEERSLLGSREAIRALSRLTETTARRMRADGTRDRPDRHAFGPATGSNCGPAIGCRRTAWSAPGPQAWTWPR